MATMKVALESIHILGDNDLVVGVEVASVKRVCRFAPVMAIAQSFLQVYWCRLRSLLLFHISIFFNLEGPLLDIRP